MNRFIRSTATVVLTAALLPLVPSGSARSQQAASPSPVYRVELLVFRATTALGGAENWGVRSDARSSGANGEPPAAQASAQIGRFSRALGPAELQLREVAARLRASGTYEPVAHVGWMQSASDWGTRAGFSVGRLGIHVRGLSGTVFLERGQFLHLGLTLDYEMAQPPEGIGAGPGTVFRLDESRRVRFYERNYYDHPAFGVIALVTPAQGSRRTGR
ncbi:MAG: CsiV family protein [Gammaproteobacteria bacterium]